MTYEPVTHYDARSQRVTNAVCNAAPHHTTPHHTTKNTSSLSDAQTRGRAIEQATTARIRSIHPVDALTVTLIEIRPDWKPEQVHATILRDRRAWTTVVAAALECALDPDVRSPFAIENHGARSRTETVPVLPSVAEALAPQLCAHEFRVGACPFCRQEAK